MIAPLKCASCHNDLYIPVGGGIIDLVITKRISSCPSCGQKTREVKNFSFCSTACLEKFVLSNSNQLLEK